MPSDSKEKCCRFKAELLVEVGHFPPPSIFPGTSWGQKVDSGECPLQPLDRHSKGQTLLRGESEGAEVESNT